MAEPVTKLAGVLYALPTILMLAACSGPSGPPPGLARPTPTPLPEGFWTDEKVVERYQQIWYHTRSTWAQNRWMGIPTDQNPNDIWILQEILFDVKPDLVVECGSFRGGSAAVWAMLLREINPEGRVLSIDIEDRMAEARKLAVVRERVDFLIGSSTAPEIVAEVTRRAQGRKVLVLLDSDHRKPHVLAELKAYAPLVPVGSYIVVQDTNVNGHPVFPKFGPGPWEAVHEFLEGNDAFVVDKSRERLLFTFAPDGYLRRVKPQAAVAAVPTP